MPQKSTIKQVIKDLFSPHDDVQAGPHGALQRVRRRGKAPRGYTSSTRSYLQIRNTEALETETRLIIAAFAHELGFAPLVRVVHDYAAEICGHVDDLLALEYAGAEEDLRQEYQGQFNAMEQNRVHVDYQLQQQCGLTQRAIGERDHQAQLHEQRIFDLQATHDNIMSREKEALGIKHRNDLARVYGDLQKTVNDHELEMAKQVSKHSIELANIRAEHTTEMEDRDQALEVERQGHKDALDRVTRDMQEEQVKHLAAIDILQAKHLTAVEELNEAHKVAVQTLKALHSRATCELHEHNQQLNEVLLRQDQEAFLPPLFRTTALPQHLDKEIGNQFMHIRHRIEDLSHTAWKPQGALWDEDDLAEACSQQTDRSVKQAILQDVIWTVLFTHIFCSPFRMFGAAGRLLEVEWTKANANAQVAESDLDHVQPIPSVLAERWRYMTLLGCREALTIRLSAQDPRAPVKKGWSLTGPDTIRDMSAELFQFIDATPATSAEIQQICEQAARLWLDLAMHRCRIEMRLMGSYRCAAEKLNDFRRSNKLRLTRVPVLGRHGNSKGTELNEFKIISNCNGNSLDIP